MPLIRIERSITAPPERCFDLARSIRFHLASTPGTGEEVLAATVPNLLGPGDEVTWRARHWGVRQRLTSRITAWERPAHFRDTQVRGAFARFDHDHWFTGSATAPGLTVMREEFDFEAPLGVLGRLVSRLALTRYMQAFLERKATILKTVAEGSEWSHYL